MAHLRQRFPLWQPLPTSTINNAQNKDGFGEDSGVGDNSQAQQGQRLFSASSARRAHKTRVSGHLLARASVLGTILPESMVCTLEYTNAKFARTLLGNADTPEVVWTSSMRMTLRNCLMEHLAPFRESLRLDPTLQYEFEPCPPIEYEQLHAELYCHSYFLRNLCDDGRFTNWPVPDPEGVLRDIIDVWRSELATASDITKGQSNTIS